jgi:flavin-dependent dehydrogenase
MLASDREESSMRTEFVDVVIVGCRPAGASAGMTLARAGADVVAVDRATFPSDTLSTHHLTPRAVSLLRHHGVLDEMLATGAPPLRHFRLFVDGFEVHPRYQVPEGIDFTLNIRRPAFDHIMAGGVRASGVDLRESFSAEEPVWEGGRLAGIRGTDADGERREIRAKLVIGADGRRSSVASWVGALAPYREWRDMRGMVWYYVDDDRSPEERSQWLFERVGDTIGFHFPTYGGALTLLMPPNAEIKQFRRDPDGMWARHLKELPQLRERLIGARPQGKQRSTDDLLSYFRRSAGPGWALVGDAGHFKDPVVGHGMHDALVWGTDLGERLAPVLERGPEEIDRELRRWERARDRNVLPSFYLGVRLGRAEPIGGAEAEFWRDLSRDQSFADELGNALTRTRPIQKTLSLRRKLRWGVTAMLRAREDHLGVLRGGAADLRLDADYYRDKLDIAVRGRAQAAAAKRWDDGWPEAVVLGKRLKETHFSTETTSLYGQEPTMPRTFDGDEGFLVAPSKADLAEVAA